MEHTSDPWHNFLAIPIAPVVLMCQLAAMFLPFPTSRRVMVIGASAVMTAMTLIVLAVADGTANIGAGLIVPQWALSLMLSVLELHKGRSARHAATDG